MKPKVNSLLAALIVSVTPLAARATSITLDFNYGEDEGPVVGVAALQGYQVKPGEYEATSGALTISGAGAVLDGIAGSYGLIANPSPGNTSYSQNGAFIYDDLVFPGTAPTTLVVTNPGVLAFGPTGGGTSEINFFSDNSSSYDLYTSNGSGYQYSHQFSVPLGSVSASVRAPDGGMTASLLGLSLAGIALLRRKMAC